MSSIRARGLWSAVLVSAAVFGSWPAPAREAKAGQQPAGRTNETEGRTAVGPPAVEPAPTPEAATSQQSANATRQLLHEVLRQYPPTVADVLRLSPSLASNADFLQPYPALSAFLTARPEVLANPSFYFGTARWTADWQDETPAARRARTAQETLAGGAAFVGLMTLLGVVVWFAHGVIAHFRWKRTLRVQADAHAKILERLTSTEDVLSYVQTPAARRFLESGAPAVELAPHDVSAPIARILWSIRTGTVLGVLGIGFFILTARFTGDEALGDTAPLLSVVGTVLLCAGAGFLLSAVVSYVLSRRLGLLAATEPR